MTRKKKDQTTDLLKAGKFALEAIVEAATKVAEFAIERNKNQLSSSKVRAVAKELDELRKVLSAYVININ